MQKNCLTKYVPIANKRGKQRQNQWQRLYDLYNWNWIFQIISVLDEVVFWLNLKENVIDFKTKPLPWIYVFIDNFKQISHCSGVSIVDFE